MAAQVESSASSDEREILNRMAPLTVQEVCAIVESVQHTRILSLSFRGLKLKFAPEPASSPEFEVLPSDQGIPAQDPQRTQEKLDELRRGLRELDGATVADNLSGIRAENHEVADDELEMLKVTDPVAFEAAMNEDPEYQDAKPR